MSTIGTNSEDLILNADGSGSDIKFKSNGTEVASISDAGVVTATSFSGSGANLTGVGVAGISSSADATAMTIDSNEHIGIGIAPKIITGGSRYLTVGTQTAGQAGFLELVGNRTANAGQDTAIMKFINNTTEIAEIGAYDNGSTNGGDLKFSTTFGGTPNVRLTIKGDGRVVSQSNAHSWVNYNQVGGMSVQDSYNVSSVTDKGTGYAWVNFDVNHGNGSYAVSGMAGNHKRVTQDGAGLATGYVAIYTSQAGQTATTDESRVFVITFGD